MAGLADIFLQKAMTPQNTGYMNAYNQGEQQAYGRGLSGALASGAPREEVMAKASYVDPMGVLKMNEAQANQDPTKRKIRELEQLWKDANRSLTQAKAVGDTQGIALYEGLITKLTGQLESLAPETWAGFGGEQPIQTGNTLTPKDTKPAIDAKEIELEEVLSGEDLNFPKIRKDLDRWALSQGIATTNPDFKILKAYITDAEKSGDKKAKKAIEAGEREFSQGLQKKRFAQSVDKEATSQDEKYKWLVGPLDNLDRDPTNTSYKLDALMTALRKESGAAIGAQEFVDFMKISLFGDDLKRFNDETTGIESVVLDMVSDSARENYLKRIANDYLSKVSSDKIRKKLGDKIPTSYLERVAKPKKVEKTEVIKQEASTQSTGGFNMDSFAEKLKGRTK